MQNQVRGNQWRKHNLIFRLNRKIRLGGRLVIYGGVSMFLLVWGLADVGVGLGISVHDNIGTGSYWNC